MPAQGRTHGTRHGVAEPLRAFLVRAARPPGRIPGGRVMSTATTVKPSLTLKRRLNAPPAKVFAAWTDPEKMKRWMGPGQVEPVSTEIEPHAGGRYRIVMRTPDG